MKRKSLTQYDEYPQEMLIYMRNYGPHFNRKLYEFAVSQMTHIVDGEERRIRPYTREQTDEILKTHGVEVKNA